MAEESPRMKWPFPEEDDDPWFEVYQDQIRAMDASAFAAREDRNLIFTGGGLISWDAGGPGLTWTQNFQLLSPTTGFFSRILPNTLDPADGQMIRFTIVRAPGSNRNVNAEVSNVVQATNDSYILGIRIGTAFFFRNGFAILDGVSILGDDLFAGGGGAIGIGGFDRVPPNKVVTIPEDGHVVVSGGMIIEGGLVLNGGSLALLGGD